MGDIRSDGPLMDLVARGQALLEQRNCREAFALFQQATQLAPHVAVAWLGLGGAYVLCDDWPAAAEAYKRAVFLGAHDASTWAQFGAALLTLQRFDEAISAYEHALAPDDTARPSGEVLALGETGAPPRQDTSTGSDLDSELRALDMALLLNPGNAEYWHWRGNVLRKKGDDEAAIQAYDQALALWPSNAHRVDREFTWASKAVSLMQLRRYDDALAACDDALSGVTDDATMWKVRGDALMHVGRSEDAVASLERAVALSPRYVSAWSSLASALRAAGRELEAKNADLRARELPDNNSTPMVETRF